MTNAVVVMVQGWCAWEREFWCYWEGFQLILLNLLFLISFNITW